MFDIRGVLPAAMSFRAIDEEDSAQPFALALSQEGFSSSCELWKTSGCAFWGVCATARSRGVFEPLQVERSEALWHQFNTAERARS